MKSFFPNTSTPPVQPWAGNTGFSLAPLFKENYEDKRKYSDDNLYRPENTDV